MIWNDIWNNKNLIKTLKEGGVAVMPTDTLYGVVGKALSQSTVDRIYRLRKRNPEKPCIILIGDKNELKKFEIVPTKAQKNEIRKYKKPTSFIVECTDKKFKYLHRGTGTLAFRMPSVKALQDLLLKVGPLIAPSANPEGLFPAQTLSEAEGYFGNSVDLYIDGGIIESKASKVIKLHSDGSRTVLRV